MNKLKYDKDRLDFVEDKRPVRYYLLKVLKFLFFTAVLMTVYYLIFFLFFKTKDQKKMITETKLIEREYKGLMEQADLLDNVVSELHSKDEQIYRTIFNSDIPDFSFFVDTMDLSNVTESQRKYLINYTRTKTSELGNVISYADSIAKELFLSVKDEETLNKLRDVPLILPIAGFPLQNIGASFGEKMHPFYKSVVFHSGLDFVAPAGTEVIATAPGVVESIVRLKTSRGTMIVINHQNGYKTSYCHLSDVLVHLGKRVEAGKVIARVGNSGTSFAPHLHYEVTYEGEYLDPLDFFMGELNLDQYEKIVMVATNNGQSLD